MTVGHICTLAQLCIVRNEQGNILNSNHYLWAWHFLQETTLDSLLFKYYVNDFYHPSHFFLTSTSDILYKNMLPNAVLTY